MLENFKSLFSFEQINATFKSPKKEQNDSKYGNMLRESKKIRLFYGNLSKKYLEKVFQKSYYSPSRANEILFCNLESRLDVVLYRAGFLKSVLSAKRAIRSGRIEVNKKKVVSPGYTVIPGDVVNISARLTSGVRTTNNEKFNFFAKTSQNLRKKESLWRFQGSPLLHSSILKENKVYRFRAINEKEQVYVQKSKKSKKLERDFFQNKEFRANLEFLLSHKINIWILSFVKDLSKKKQLRNRFLPVLQSKDLYANNSSISNLSINFFFSTYLLCLKNKIISLQKKRLAFLKQKTQPFFKNQIVLLSKRTKPLHLEISYQSRSLIFLFPPQQLYFPSFINLSQIFK